MNNTTTSPVFRTATLSKTSTFQRLLHQQPEENAVIEVNNLLATRPVRSIEKTDITAIEQRYTLHLHTEFPLNLEEFYAVYLNYCLDDKKLSDEEVRDLQHLKSILGLDEKSIGNLHTRIGGKVYQQALIEAISGGRLTPEAADSLAELAASLQLPEQLTEKIASQIKLSYMQQYLQKLLSRQRVSPDEEQELKAMPENFGLPLPIDDKTHKKIQLYRQYWDLQNLPLRAIIPDITIQAPEECYFMAGAIGWFELRSIRHKSVTTHEMTKIDHGSLYLTNRRIIFNGSGKNLNIQLDKILSIKKTDNGIEINKGASKNPELRFPDRADIFYMILDRLLRKQ